MSSNQSRLYSIWAFQLDSFLHSLYHGFRKKCKIIYLFFSWYQFQIHESLEALWNWKLKRRSNIIWRFSLFLPLSLSSRVLDEEYNPGFESSLNFDMPFCFSATPLLDFEGDFKRPFRVLWSPNLTIWGQCFRAFPKNLHYFMAPQWLTHRLPSLLATLADQSAAASLLGRPLPSWLARSKQAIPNKEEINPHILIVLF